MRARHLSPAQIDRLVTSGVPTVEALCLHVDMAPCASRHAPTVRARSYDYLRRYAGGLPATAAHLADTFGVPQPRTHAALTPLATFAASLPEEALVSLLQVLDRAATDAAIDRVEVPTAYAQSTRMWSTALARAQGLYVRLDAARIADDTALAAPLAALLKDDAGARVLVAFGEASQGMDAPARLDVRLSWAPSPGTATDVLGGLARVGHRVVAAGATALSRFTGLPVSAGEVEIAVDAAAWLAGSEGHLAPLHHLDLHLTRQTLRDATRCRVVVPDHVRPSEAAAVVTAGTYPQPTPLTAAQLTDLAAVSAATGHAALLIRSAPSR